MAGLLLRRASSRCVCALIAFALLFITASYVCPVPAAHAIFLRRSKKISASGNNNPAVRVQENVDLDGHPAATATATDDGTSLLLVATHARSDDVHVHVSQAPQSPIAKDAATVGVARSPRTPGRVRRRSDLFSRARSLSVSRARSEAALELEAEAIARCERADLRTVSAAVGERRPS